jgi:hypothetical protein
MEPALTQGAKPFDQFARVLLGELTRSVSQSPQPLLQPRLR